MKKYSIFILPVLCLLTCVKQLSAQVAVSNFDNEFKIYKEKTANVRKLEDQLALIESLPAIRAAFVESAGGEEAYRKQCEERLKIQWHIYRNKDGILIFEKPEEDLGKSTEERLDNKS